MSDQPDKPTTGSIRLDSLKPGDKVRRIGRHDCLYGGWRTVQAGADGLFVKCREGTHYLDGHLEEDGSLSGLERMT